MKHSNDLKELEKRINWINPHLKFFNSEELSVALPYNLRYRRYCDMQKTVRLNAFAAMKLQKEVKKAKGKEALLRHFERLQHQKSELQNVPVITTIW